MAKTKLTPELQEKFCKAIENGDSILGACGYVGITERTYYNWMDRAAEAKTRTKLSSKNVLIKQKLKHYIILNKLLRMPVWNIGKLQHGCWKEDILTCMVNERKSKLMLIIKV